MPRSLGISSLSKVYSRLPVPVDWIGLAQYRKIWIDSVRFACKLFNHHIDGGSILQSFASITRDGNIDFGLLDEGSQKKVLDGLLEDQKKYDRLLRLNPFLSNPGQVQNGHDLILHNQDCTTIWLTFILEPDNMRNAGNSWMHPYIYRSSGCQDWNHCYLVTGIHTSNGNGFPIWKRHTDSISELIPL